MTASKEADFSLQPDDIQLAKAALAGEIKRLLQSHGVSQTRAARRLGISQPDLSKIVRGKLRNCSLERLLRILKQLGRSVAIQLQATLPDKPPEITCRIGAPWSRPSLPSDLFNDT